MLILRLLVLDHQNLFKSLSIYRISLGTHTDLAAMEEKMSMLQFLLSASSQPVYFKILKFKMLFSLLSVCICWC